MSKITPEILAKIAPSTPHGLRDRFIPYMNEAMPRYGITTKFRVGAFLATTCFESQWFQKTKEGKARANTKAGRAQAKYWPSGYFGRGLIQTTHQTNYEILGEYLHEKGIIDDPDLFVDNPELLEEPKWAVESACVFWETNHLNRFADAQNIFAVEGITNRGNAGKEAWGEAVRERVWKILLRILPNDFDFNEVSTAAPAPLLTPVPTSTDEAATDDATNAPVDTSQIEQPPTPDTANVLAPVQTADTIVNTGDVATPTPAPTDVTLAAPAGMGSVQGATKATIFGIGVPASFYTIFAAIKSAMDNGFVDARDIGSAVMSFISQNTKYVFVLIGGVITVIIVKKICRELIFLATVVSHMFPSLNNVTIVAPEPVQQTKSWWRFW